MPRWGINKTVLVSSSGFTSEAKLKATALGMDALTLEEAESTPWGDYIESLSNLRFAGFTLSWIDTKLTLVEPPTQSTFDDSSEVTAEELGFKGTVEAFSTFLPRVRNGEGPRLVMKAWFETPDRPSGYERTLNWVPEKPAFVSDTSGRQHVVKSAHCRLKVVVANTPMSMTAVRFRGVNLAVGEAQDVFQDDPSRKFVLVSQDQDGSLGPGMLLTPEGRVAPVMEHLSSTPDVK